MINQQTRRVSSIFFAINNQKLTDLNDVISIVELMGIYHTRISASSNQPQRTAAVGAGEVRQEGRLPMSELRKGIPARKSEGDAHRLEGGPEEDRGEKSSPARP